MSIGPPVTGGFELGDVVSAAAGGGSDEERFDDDDDYDIAAASVAAPAPAPAPARSPRAPCADAGQTSVGVGVERVISGGSVHTSVPRCSARTRWRAPRSVDAGRR